MAGKASATVRDEGIPQSANRLRTWILGLTSVLVVMPALINAALDIRNVLLNIPRSEAEQINQSFYERYFGQTPVFKGSVPVKTEYGTLEMNLEVHGSGDLFVRYGGRSQWFPSPLNTTHASAGLISEAVAADPGEPLPAEYQQRELRSGGKLVRELYLPDGRKLVYEINPVSGRWTQASSGSWQTLPEGVSKVQKTVELPVIDLTRPQR